MGVAEGKKRELTAKPKMVRLRREKRPGPYYGPVAAQLRALREDYRPEITAKQLSVKIGAPNQVWVSRHENGNVRIPVDELEGWAAGLDHEVAILFTPKGLPPADLLKAAAAAGPAAIADAIAFLHAWPRMSVGMRDIVRRAIAETPPKV